jgi:hypothetical protein
MLDKKYEVEVIVREHDDEAGVACRMRIIVYADDIKKAIDKATDHVNGSYIVVAVIEGEGNSTASWPVVL